MVNCSELVHSSGDTVEVVQYSQIIIERGRPNNKKQETVNNQKTVEAFSIVVYTMENNSEYLKE